MANQSEFIAGFDTRPPRDQHATPIIARDDTRVDETQTAEVGRDGGRKSGIKGEVVYPFTPLIDGARGLLKGPRAT